MKKHTATFAFTAQGATGFSCALVKPNKGHHKHKPKPHFATCHSPKKFKKLQNGRYQFLVRGTNSNGTGPTASKRFKI